MDSNHKRKHDRAILQEIKSRTVQGNDPDIYDVPDSPIKRARSGTWRPWGLSQNAPGDTICVSTPDRRAETIRRKESSLPPKQHATPDSKPTTISRIKEALKTKFSEGLTFDEIFDWFCINESKPHEGRGLAKLRSLVRQALDRELEKKEPKVWRDTDGTWRLKPGVAEPNAEESTKTHAKRQTYTPSLSVQSSTGGQTSDGTPEIYEDTPQSELQQSGKGDYENGQDVQPLAFLQTEHEYGSTSVGNRPKAPSQETDANAGNETPQPRAATHSARTSNEQPSNHDDTPTQYNEPPAESTLTIHNDKLSSIEEAQFSVHSCDGPERDGEDEPDFGAIVRELRRMKEERETKELEIKEEYNAMPDMSVLTQSAEGAQHAADEARRAAEEAQRVANEAQCVAVANRKTLEEAFAKKRQIAADELYLEELIRDSTLLRSKLGID
jgi:hypothetical protein